MEAEDDAVPWRDLVAVSRRETWAELALPVPWLALAVLCGVAEFTPGVAGATLVVFMMGVRLNHGAVHGTLGLAGRGNDLVMAAVSVLLGGATHALAHTHRIHHRRCLAPDDLEGRAAAYGFWQALWRSPLYPLQIHAAALRQEDPRLRRWVLGELLAVAGVQVAVWLLLDVRALRTAGLTLLAANALVPMVGIWAVHRGCHGTGHVARTSRSRWLGRLTVGMFQHDEHHRYPRVPTRHLPELVRRLDARGSGAAPAVVELPACRPSWRRRPDRDAAIPVPGPAWSATLGHGPSCRTTRVAHPTSLRFSSST